MSKALNHVINTKEASSAALMNISGAYLEGVMNLTVLGFSTMRETMEGFDVASKKLAAGTAEQLLKDLPATLGQSLLERSVDYSRGAWEIIARTQSEITRLSLAQLASVDFAATVPANLSGMLDQFTKGFQQCATSASDSVRSASEAGSEAIATMGRPVRKVA
jgi:phasin family protein